MRLGRALQTVLRPPTSLLFLCLLIVSAYAQSPDSLWRAKVDPRLGLRWSGAMSTTATRLSAARESQRVIVRFADERAEPPVGLTVLTRSGRIAVAELSLDRLQEVASSAAVTRIRLPRAYHLNDDECLASIRAERVQPRLGVTGKGVIVGVLDTGIDWSHPDFIREDGTSRILYILDLSDSLKYKKYEELGDRGPFGSILYTRGMIRKALAGEGVVRERDYFGHGTHVTAVAAGSAFRAPASQLTYGGVAPGADIVFVKVTATPHDSSLTDAAIMNGAWFVDSVAHALGQPYVLNLSLGGSTGAHDGTDELDEYLAALVAPGKTGRAVVAAAGNSRVDRVHAAGDFSQEPDSVVWLEIDVLVGMGGSMNEVYFEAWLSDDNPGVSVTVVSPRDSAYGPFADGYGMGSSAGITRDGQITVNNAYGGVEPQNGNRLVSISLLDASWFKPDPLHTTFYSIRSGVWKIGLRATKGKFDAYLYGSRWVQTAFRNYYTQSGTVESPAAHPDIIAVGAYVARDDYTTLDPPGGSGAALRGAPALGRLATFSSAGPNRKGVQKPELCAPGQWVVSALSRAADPVNETLSIFRSPLTAYPYLMLTPDSIHAVSQGTSFSAPHVAGLIALLLEADPSLDNTALRKILTETATSDSATGALPDNLFGYGRANAVGAVRRVLGISRDSVRLAASVEPAAGVISDSLVYTVAADLSGSAEALREFSFSVQFPAEALSPELRLDSLGRLSDDPRIRIDTAQVKAGQLAVSGTRQDGYLTRDSLFHLTFRPVGRTARDSVHLSLGLLSLSGDLAPLDLSGITLLAQSAPVSLGASHYCLLTGDLDGDGRRSVFDLLELLKILSGTKEGGVCADVDGSGKTDIFDLLDLLKLLSGGQ